jgi:hypothetical protein
VSRLNPSRPFPLGTKKRKKRKKRKRRVRGRARKMVKAMLARALVLTRECSVRVAR